MVVLDENQVPQGKDSQAKVPPTKNDGSGPSDAPPAYDGQQGTYPVDPVVEEGRPLLHPPDAGVNANAQPAYAAGTGHPIPPVPPANWGGAEYGVYHRRHGESPGWRFLKTLFVAVVVWMLLGAFVRSLVWVAGGPYGRGKQVWRLSSYPIPEGVTLSNCLNPDDWNEPYRAGVQFNASAFNEASSAYPYASTTAFDLPLSAVNLYLLLRGPYASGTVTVVTSAGQASENAKVVVTVNYYAEGVRDLVKVCRVSKESDDAGVGIFTPRSLGWTHPGKGQLYFETFIILPEVRAGQDPLRVNGLEIDVANTVQTVLTGVDKVVFKRLEMKGSNAGISVDAAAEHYAHIQTSNGAISGLLNSTGDVTLKTANAHIKVEVGLISTVEASKANELRMITSNGFLEARVSLYSSASNLRSRTIPEYKVDAITTNAKNTVTFLDSPSESILRFKGTSSNGALRAHMHPAFQGHFEVETSAHIPNQLIYDPNIPDPAGKGRTRSLVGNRVGDTIVKGRVEWVDPGKKGEEGNVAMGSVEMRTSNANAALVL